jgi:single-stranded-DNA-specific exonuclease
MTRQPFAEPESSAPFLGVEQSLGGRRWYERGGDSRLALALAQRLSLPETVGRLLAARGIGLEEADVFLNPTLKALLPDPSGFKDMDKAAARIADALEQRQLMGIFGDYDVDGATSSALLNRYFTALGQPPAVYIPDRMTEGYGPNAAALLRLKQQGVRLVITVDCGATAHAPLQAAADAGLEVIVCDHHVGEPRLPPAVAVVNPNRFDEETPHRTLAAVGVAFLLTVAVNRTLRQRGWFQQQGIREPNLMQWLDLVALGTVCDVVPLVGVNRALVTQGLAVLRQRGNAGLAALADVARVKETPEAFHLGYILGPRVNAGGRVGEAPLGSRLLACDNPAEAEAIARRLHEFNEERRAIEAGVLEEAIALVESGAAADEHLVFAVGEGWHPGVIGIVASRLKERYNRPACVVGVDDQGVAKGSGRSIAGVNLGEAVIAARQADLLTHGGGHAMAAGFSGTGERMAEVRAFLSQRIGHQIPPGGLVPRLGIDGTLDVLGADGALMATLSQLAPFGAGNSEPRFVVTPARIVRADVAGEAHVRLILTGPSGGRLKAIAFRCLEEPLGQALLHHQGRYLHLAGHLRSDSWQGQDAVQLVIEDAAFSL